jgi:cytochrome b561
MRFETTRMEIPPRLERRNGRTGRPPAGSKLNTGGWQQKELHQLADDEEHQPRSLSPGQACCAATMTDSPSSWRWPAAIRLLHWLTVAALGLQTVVAFGPMKGPGMATMYWLPTHISTGVLILALVFVRLGLRAFTKVPTGRHAPWIQASSAFAHAGLYALMVAIVITGWLAYRPMPLMAPARLFASVTVPVAPAIAGLSAREMAAIHSTLFWVFTALVGAHALAAAMHAVLFRDGTMRAMWFGDKRKSSASNCS